jgi:hypothetical protein
MLVSYSTVTTNGPGPGCVAVLLMTCQRVVFSVGAAGKISRPVRQGEVRGSRCKDEVLSSGAVCR